MKFTPVLLILHVCLILCITLTNQCYAGEEEEINNISEQELIPLEKVEVNVLASREEAESFALELQRSGYKTVITGDKGDNQGYKVFILIDKKDQEVPKLSSELSEAPAGYAKKPSWEILGRRHHNVHASLTLTGTFTDNALNSRSDKKSDFSTILSPAIWIVFPDANQNQNIEPFSLSVRSPGGSLLTRQRPDSLVHYRASLYYQTDIPLTSSSGGLVYGKIPVQTLTGRVMLTGNRFSILAEDQYEFSHLVQQAGLVTTPGEQEDRYNSNLLNLTLSYASRNRLVFQAGYSYFITNYKSDLGSFRDRRDNGLSASVSYKLSQKMGLIAQYRYINVSYDKTSGLDSGEHYLMGGISWDITAKSKGLLMAGYGVKNFDRSLGSFGNFSLEAQIDHRFTPKTSLLLNAYRKTSETDVTGAAFSLTNGVNVKLQHLLTSRLTTSAGFSIINDHYQQGPGLAESFDSRLYQVDLALQYAFKRWLKGGIGYEYTIRNSSMPEIEYRSNTFYFNITAAI